MSTMDRLGMYKQGKERNDSVERKLCTYTMDSVEKKKYLQCTVTCYLSYF